MEIAYEISYKIAYEMEEIGSGLCKPNTWCCSDSRTKSPNDLFVRMVPAW